MKLLFYPSKTLKFIVCVTWKPGVKTKLPEISPIFSPCSLLLLTLSNEVRASLSISHMSPFGEQEREKVQK